VVTLAAWVAFPLAFYLVAAGVGLLAERVVRTHLPSALLAPTGACLSIVIVALALELGAGGVVLAALLVVAAVVGLLLGRRGLHRRLLPGWAGIAALLAFALYLGPVALTGHWTWLGYNFVNDTATNFAVIDHIAHHGTAPVAGEVSTRLVVINTTLAQGYPLAAHALVAGLIRIVPVPVEAVYQPFIACVAAFAAMALAWLAQSLRVPRPAAAFIAVVAVGANLTYHYALHGAFKELATVMVVATAAALCRFVLDERLALGPVALLAACLVAAVAIFTVGAAGYAAALVVAALVALARERLRIPRRSLVRAFAVGAAVTVVAATPVIAGSLDFTRTSSRIFADSNADLSAPLRSPAVLGHLVRPLPVYQSLGTWLRADYRYPIRPGSARTLTIVLLVLAGALLAVALAIDWRRRRLGVLLAAAPALAVYLVGAPRLEPYAEAKLLVVASPLVVFGAALGAWWLLRRVRVAGVVACAALAGGVLVSDALAYHSARIAPVNRLEALREAAEHAGPGAVLLPEWEELAKHFGASAAIDVGPEAFSPRPFALRTPEPVFNRSFDLDQLRTAYVTSFPWLLLRRSPEASRPPANYRLAFRNHWYELWRQQDEPVVLDHLPLQEPGQPAALPRCQDVRALAARAEAGDQLVAYRRPRLPTIGAALEPAPGTIRPERMPRWPPPLDDPNATVPSGGGVITARLTLAAGTYRVWLKGGGGRQLAISVDGHAAGTVQEVNTPGGWLMYGVVRVPAGAHTVTLTRPRADLAPGNGFSGVFSRIALEPLTPRALVTLPPAQADRLCGRTWDWIELVRGAPRS
jgi:hypothetical protein